MTIEVQPLGIEPGCVRDVVHGGAAGPAVRGAPRTVCVAAVTRGTFRYRSAQGARALGRAARQSRPLLECGHEHGIGDRCVSVHLAPEFWEDIVAAVPGARTYPLPRLPLPTLEPLIARWGQAATDAAGCELALESAGAVAGSRWRGPRPAPQVRASRGASPTWSAGSSETRGRNDGALLSVRWREAAMSPYHFQRVFREIVGMTPHQWLGAHASRRRAGRRSASPSPPSRSTPASTICRSRRFRRIMGASPTAFRMQRRAAPALHSMAPRLLAQ
jgi:hypothetical protein